MIEKIRNSKKLNYYVMTSLIIFQLGTIVWFCIELSFFSIYIHITNWSFCISSIYLFLTLICDTNSYFFSSNKLDNFSYFLRNSFSKIAYPYCFMITIGFWMILFIGLIFRTETFTKSGAKISTFRIICNFHLHFGITIIMFIELLLNKRGEMKLTLDSGIANTIIFICYTIMVCIAKYNFNKNAYFFMSKMSFLTIILVGSAIFCLLIGSIFIYNEVSNGINRKYINEIKSKQYKELIIEAEMQRL